MSRVEADLWDAWRARRDGEAFERLVRPHLGFAAGFARRLGCADADADEVVQRSLVALAAERRDVPARVGLRAWIGRSVLSESRMLFRARRRREAHEGRAVPAASPAGNPVDARDEVEALLASLPEDARRALELRYLYDLDYREIAAVLGTSALACRLRVHRAVTALRRRFGAHGAMLVAALPHRTADTSGVTVATAAASAPAVSTSLLVGGLAMGIAWKSAAVVTAVLAIGAGAWVALRRTPDDGGSAVASARPPRAEPGLAAGNAKAPPALAAAGGTAASDAAAPAGSSSAASAATPSSVVDPPPVPLDAPIPPGTASVAGTLRWTDGTPAAGLRLGLSGYPRKTVVTDAEGRYHLHGEWAIASRSLSLTGPNEYILTLRWVKLEADRRSTVDVVLERGVRVFGRVVAAGTGAPIVDALVVIRRTGGAGGLQAGAAWVHADADGRWAFDHVPSDAYTWKCWAPGFELQEGRLEVGAKPVEHDLRLADSRRLVVRIEGLPAEATGRRQTVGFGKLPLGAEDVSFAAWGTLEADGTMRVDLPPPGRWHVTVAGDEFVPHFETELVVTTDPPAPLVLSAPRGVAFAGVLRDARGRSLPGVDVQLGDAGATTDGSGRFRFPVAVPGRHVPRLRLEHGTVDLKPVDVPASGAAEADMSVAGDAEVRVTVDDVQCTVALWQGTPERMVANAPAEGNRSVRVPHLGPGAYRAVIGTYSLFEVREFTLVAGQVLDLGLVAIPVSVPVPVVVTSASGGEIPTFQRLHFQRDLGGSVAGRPTPTPYLELDGKGAGWLRGLVAGRFLLSMRADGFAPVEFDVDVREGITTPLRIELRKP